MLDFHTWVSRMANSIEDKSIIAKSSPTLNSLQIRSLMADMIVPNTNTESLVGDWVAVFTVGLDEGPIGDRLLVSKHLKSIVGEDEHNSYVQTWGDVESVAWLKEFKGRIWRG